MHPLKCSLLSFGTALFFLTAMSVSASKPYPVPKGIALNPDFQVTIVSDGKRHEVPVQDLVDSCFAHSEVDGNVQIEVTCKQEVKHCRLSPLRRGIPVKVDGRTMRFTIDEPAKLILLVNDGASNHTTGLDGLCIFADAPEVDPPEFSDQNVVNILDYDVDSNGNGNALRLQDPEGRKNKTHNIQFQGSNHVTIEGISSVNAGSWNIEPIFCDDLTIRNVKVLSDLRYYGKAKINTDGIDINKCRHVLVDDCLVYSTAVSAQGATTEWSIAARWQALRAGWGLES